LFFELFNRLDDVLELAADELDAQGKALVQSGLIADRDSLLQEFEPRFDELLAAGTLEIIKLFEVRWAGFLGGRQGGPLEEEGSGQGAPQILPTQLQGLWIIGFKQGLEAIGQGGAFIDNGAAMGHQLLEQPGLAVLGLPGFELVRMHQEQLGQIACIQAIILGAAGDKGLAVFLQGDGVESDPGIGFQEGNEMARGLVRGPERL
jgi:hypothetical protein